MSFENFRFSKPKLSEISKIERTLSQELYENNNSTPSELTSATNSSKLKVTKCLKSAGFESNISYCNDSTRKNTTSMNIHHEQHNPFDLPESIPTHEEHSKGTNILSSSLKEIKSSESFLPTAAFDKRHNIYFSSDNLSSTFKTLRLFNRNGKPLTDRMGRPLLGIFGQPLVNIDDEGRLISDVKGNQVFNSLGESAIYSTTNLFVPPSEEEPGIPLLDVDRKHILFLYDNTGHPLTDSLGRPLLKASGNLMFGISPKEKLNVNSYKQYSLRTIYGKAPLENFVRLVQIFNSSLNPLTDEYGKPLRNSKIICNKHGMPMCSEDGNPLLFKYGTRIDNSLLANNINYNSKPVERLTHNFYLKSSKDSFHKPIFDSNNFVSLKEYCLAESSVDTYKCKENKMCDGKNENIPNNKDLKSPNVTSHLEVLKRSLQNYPDSALDETSCIKNQIDPLHCDSNSINRPNASNFKLSCRKLTLLGKTSHNMSYSHINQKRYICAASHNDKPINFENELVKNGDTSTGEAVILFDRSRTVETQKSSSNELAIKDIRNARIGHSFLRRKPYKNVFRTNILQYFKNAVNMTNIKYIDDRPIFNDYGKPMKDLYGNLLYDKYGIPLTGADGIKLSEKTRQVLRLKLRNIPINKDKTIKGEALMSALTYNKLCDQYGDPYYDKHGRPLYDLFGKLIYDIYGRPLTDAFNRPLIDAIGQPLMDSKGNVLTSDLNNSKMTTMVDIFGRHLYDKRGRALFDSYGRPRFDIYSNAVYDVCGRPATDGNGIKLYDFLNNAIQPYPDKPLYKNARNLLPKYIDRILTTPSLHLVLKYSQASLKDIFGGPLFDDFGKPLYNKIGKPLYDKYGRPLYDKDGSPLCDQYGRPLSEEIRQSPNDTTVSVVDSLKLLKLTKESSMWMEIKRSQTQALKKTESGALGNDVI